MVEPDDLFGNARLLRHDRDHCTAARCCFCRGHARGHRSGTVHHQSSSGKQGVAVAQAALDAGAAVTLIVTPGCEQWPLAQPSSRWNRRRTWLRLCWRLSTAPDVLFMVAAVADFKPEWAAERKIKKSDDSG